MLYANDEIFNIGYNENLDRLEVKDKKTRKIKQTLGQHKFIATVSVMFVLFSIMNCVLIYTFMQMLKNI